MPGEGPVAAVRHAGSLARDIDRHLTGDAVEAGPPSAWYNSASCAAAPGGAGGDRGVRGALDRGRRGRDIPGCARARRAEAATRKALDRRPKPRSGPRTPSMRRGGP